MQFCLFMFSIVKQMFFLSYLLFLNSPWYFLYSFTIFSSILLYFLKANIFKFPTFLHLPNLILNWTFLFL